MKRMTDEEVIQELQKGSDSKLNRARSTLSNEMGKLGQAALQRQPLTPVEFRRMEFETVRKIAKILGVEI